MVGATLAVALVMCQSRPSWSSRLLRRSAMTWASSLSFILASGPIGPGRPIFEFFTPIMEVTFYALAAISTLVFVLGVILKVRKYWRGKPDTRLDHLPRRLGRAIRLVAQNATVGKRDRYAGIGHF